MGTNHISGTVEAKVVKFCTGRLYHVPAKERQITHERGVVRVTCPFSNFDVRNHISGTAETRVAKILHLICQVLAL